jgi:hypothetical protein
MARYIEPQPTPLAIGPLGCIRSEHRIVLVITLEKFGASAMLISHCRPLEVYSYGGFSVPPPNKSSVLSR